MMDAATEARILHHRPRDRHHTRNPLARHLYHRYLKDISEMVVRHEPKRILEVGCGIGYLAAHIKSMLPDSTVVAVDLSERIVREAAQTFPDIDFQVGSAYDLPFEENSFDMVLGAEILEYLHDPQKALREMYRVTRRHVLLSVPKQPQWRAMNMVRLAYLDHFGSHPGHVQSFNKGDFMRMVKGHFRVAELREPLPWVVVVGRKGGI